MSGRQCSDPEHHSRVIRIIRPGEPSEEELAALTVVLAGLTAAPQPADPATTRSTWADPALGLRTPHYPGPDAWRTSTSGS
jgi:hypothetical protein